jgi:hypothetical protein
METGCENRDETTPPRTTWNSCKQRADFLKKTGCRVFFVEKRIFMPPPSGRQRHEQPRFASFGKRIR